MKMAKRTLSLVLVLCLSILNLNMVNATESDTKVEVSDRNKHYIESFTDENGDKIRVEAFEDNDEYIARTYVNDKLLSQSVRVINKNGEYSNKITNTRYNDRGITKSDQVYYVDDLVTVNTKLTQPQSLRSSYSYLETKYIPDHYAYAYLYGYEENYSREALIYVPAWSPLELFVSALPGWVFGTGWGTVAILTALGTAVIGGFLVDLVDGTITQNVEKWNYKLMIDEDFHTPDELAQIGYISNVSTRVYDTNGDYETKYSIEKSGPYDTRDEFISYGIYIFYL